MSRRPLLQVASVIDDPSPKSNESWARTTFPKFIEPAFADPERLSRLGNSEAGLVDVEFAQTVCSLAAM
jgi:hypothetical protein